jgi:hypothetical protein
MRPRPRLEETPPVDVDFIVSEGHRLERVSLGSGLNFYGMCIAVDVPDGESREREGGEARHGLLIFLPSVSIEQVLASRRQREEAGTDEPGPFRRPR